MKTIRFLLFAVVVLTISTIFCACDNGDDNENSKEYTIIVASIQTIMFNSDHHYPYFVKYEGTNEWVHHSRISGFSYTEGYEYVIRVRRDYDKSEEEVLGGSPYSFILLEEISKTQKDSENIPLQNGWINIHSNGTGDPDFPYYVFESYTGSWKKFPPIEGFEFEEGYKYAIGVSCKYNGVNAPQKYSYTYIETYRKEKVDSM